MPRRDRLPAREEPGTPETSTGNGGYGGGSRRTSVSSKEFPDPDGSKQKKRFSLGLKEVFIHSFAKLRKRFTS